MNNKSKKTIMLVIGFAVMIVALWWSTRNVKLQDFIGELKNFQAWWLIPALATFYYSMYLRAVRWGLLFRPHHHFKGYQVFRPLMLCFGFNCVLPGRVGEVARAVVVGKKTGLPTALATVVAERIIDASTLMGLLAFSLMVLPKVDPAMNVQVWDYAVSGAQFNKLKAKIVLLSIVLVVGVIVFMIPLTQRILHGVIRRLPVGERFQAKLHHILTHFAQGFHALKEPGVMARILVHSVVLWVLIGVSNLMIAKGFNMPMNLAQAEAQMVITAIFITLPATPGYWGLFEAGMIFSSLVLGIVRAEQQSLALAYALVVHIVQYLPIVVMGLIFAWQLNMKPAAVEAVEDHSQTSDKAAAAEPAN